MRPAEHHPGSNRDRAVETRPVRALGPATIGPSVADLGGGAWGHARCTITTAIDTIL